MATYQKQASVARNILFRSSGLNYSTFLHASTGDLIQQYDDEGNFYPNITPTNPIRVQFTATSSKSKGTVVPDSITYKIAGVTLTFDATGKCTNTSPANSDFKAEDMFKKEGADLLIIGNIAGYLNYVSSLLEAFATKGSDDLYASCPVDISMRVGGLRQKVSIAPGDDKNFTLRSQTDSVILMAGVLLRTGWSYNNPDYRYVWEIADPTSSTGWTCLQVGTGVGSLTVEADQVNTYANIKCTVIAKSLFSTGGLTSTGGTTSGSNPSATLENASTFSWDDVNKNLIIGSDCVGVLDASDPLDIYCTVKINKTGTGTEEAADEEVLYDSMPDNAYLIYTPTLVVRGETTSAGPTTWLNGLITDPAGVSILNIVPTNNKYKVCVSDISSSYGQHTLIMTGKLT